MKKILILLALMSALLVSCEKPENNEPEPEPEPEPEYAISISPAELTFGAEGGDAEVTITITNSDEWRVWRISSMPDWIEITEQYGENGATITVTAKEYNAEAESRSGEIVFIYENKDAKVSVTQKADESPIIQFKDPKFLERALRHFNVDRNGDGQISEKEASVCTGLGVSDAGIRNLEEIKYFTALTSLSCNNNQLTSLDLSNNTALASLECNDNQLTSLDLSNNTALASLECNDNQLTSLDVSNNTVLTELSCDYNQLTSLDVSNNAALTELSCGGNQLASLDVSKNTKLKYLDCRDNKLSMIDVSQNTQLTTLDCAANYSITHLDLGKNKVLESLYCVGRSVINGKYTEVIPLESLVLYKYNMLNDWSWMLLNGAYPDLEITYVE